MSHGEIRAATTHTGHSSLAGRSEVVLDAQVNDADKHFGDTEFVHRVTLDIYEFLAGEAVEFLFEGRADAPVDLFPWALNRGVVNRLDQMHGIPVLM